MKYTRLVLVSLIILNINACSFDDGEPYNKADLKDFHSKELIFYNVENLFDFKDDPKTKDDDFLPDGKKKWTKKRFVKKVNGIAKVLTEVASDFPILVGLVELENRYCLDALIKSELIKRGSYAYVHEDSKDVRGMDAALLYQTDYLALLASEFLSVKLKNGKNSRAILYAEFGLNNGESLYVYVNHWPSRRQGKLKSEQNRIKAATVLREHLDDLLSVVPSAKVLVMGDFNDYPSDKSISQILRADSIESGKSDAELFNLAYELDSNQKGTYFYKGAWGMLDQMLVSRSFLKGDTGLAINSNNFGIFEPDWLMYFPKGSGKAKPNRTYGGNKYYGGYSDHLPIHLKLD